VQIYEVCEEHGRIAYRRADGSRLITSNDHWKSQVRHALYTGGRFERVPSNGEYWQLTSASRGSAAELVKVLVRADDEYLHIRATLELTPSTARTAVAKTNTTATAGHDSRQQQQQAGGGGSSRQRRKRTSPTADAGSIDNEAMCDSIDPAAAPGGMRGPVDYSLRQNRGTRLTVDGGAPDNHSTQDEDFDDFDEIRDLPTTTTRANNNNNRSKRVSRKPTWKVANASEEDEEAVAALAGTRRPPPFYNNQAIKSEEKYTTAAANAHVHQASKDSADPSTLRWGATCLRSTYIISATAGESSGLSAGRTPLVPGRRAGGGVAAAAVAAPAGFNRLVRDTSAEADSAPMKKLRQTYALPPSGGDRDGAGPPKKRQAVGGVPLPTSNSRQLPTPQAQAEGPGSTAQMTPPFISQWAEAMQHHLEEAAAAAQKQRQNAAEGGAGSTAAAAAAGEAAAAAAAAGWPAGAGIPGLPAGFPPMAMLPAMLPGLLAAAAPYFSNQQAQQQMQQQMQAFMLNPSAAAAAVAAATAAANAAPHNTEDQ
jgi:hypothetical protein